jgi:hypothetical protein
MAVAKMTSLFMQETVLPSAPHDRVTRLEKYFEVTFPVSYLAFLKNANGAKPKNQVLPVGKGDIVIERFLPIVSDIENDPHSWADISVVDTQIGERLGDDPYETGSKLIPIAALFAGDFLVLDYRKDKNVPSVGIWDHERSEYLKPHIETLAPSFEAFLELLAEKGSPLN